jgi:hypothetical protein
MKKRIQEEKQRIISLFGINEQEEDMGKLEMDMENIVASPLDKFKKIKFYDAKMKPIEFTSDEEDSVVSKIDDIDGGNGDNAIVRAAVSVKGGKDEPIIKYGSFATDSEIIDRDSIFDEDEVVSDGDTVRDYFEIKMSGPDIDDYKVVRLGVEDFESEDETEMDKGKVEKETEPQEPVSKEPEQPFEEEMKLKEKKGLATLLDTNEVSNDFTKRQKKVLEKLKGEGYLLKRPENTEGYTKKKVTSKEFTEAFNVWEPKK